MEDQHDRNIGLPVKRSLGIHYVASLIIVALMAAASIAGVVARDAVYPTVELVHAFVPNDVVNLAVGAPILLVSMALARRGSLAGLLCWPGALFYVLYNYLSYVLAMPLTAVTLLHLALAALSAYALAGLLAVIDSSALAARLRGAVRERLAGGILAGLGILILGRAAAFLAGPLFGQPTSNEAVFAVNSTDFMIAPAWIIGGILLWRKRSFGYAAGLGLLFQASMLFIALIAFLLLQPVLTDAPFALGDVLVILVMGMVCFVPFALYIRGGIRSARKIE